MNRAAPLKERPCALCLQTKPLRKSHILPEFLYSEDMYDEAHRLLTKSATTELKARQKGYWERLLCADCETLISRWERYAADVFRNKVQVTGQPRGSVLMIEGIDYRKFKLFLLSILWRASVAKDPFFNQVQLGIYEEKLRQMLLGEEPGPADAYPCFIATALLEGKLADVMIEPTKGRLGKNILYNFTFGGFHWTFLVSTRNIDPGFSSICLSESGKVHILVKEITDYEYIVDLIARVIRREESQKKKRQTGRVNGDTG